MQKAWIKSLLLEAPVVTQQPVVTQLTPQQQMELEVLKLRLQSEAVKKKNSREEKQTGR